MIKGQNVDGGFGSPYPACFRCFSGSNISESNDPQMIVLISKMRTNLVMVPHWMRFVGVGEASKSDWIRAPPGPDLETHWCRLYEFALNPFVGLYECTNLCLTIVFFTLQPMSILTSQGIKKKKSMFYAVVVVTLSLIEGIIITNLTRIQISIRVSFLFIKTIVCACMCLNKIPENLIFFPLCNYLWTLTAYHRSSQIALDGREQARQ